MPSAQRMVLACLLGLGAALLLVGVVSGTLLRHVVQILPIILAVVVTARRPTWGAFAAMPIFVFWLFIVVLIWLFLLGLSNVASGHYTMAEIISTFLMAAFSVAGIVKSIHLGKTLRPQTRLSTFLLFGGLQVFAMWVSLLRPITNR